jgi:hypothetical protein
MSRNIITKNPIGTLLNQPGAQTDEYVSKIIKLIPAEIVSVYLAVFNIADSNRQQTNGNNGLQWMVFVLILIITPFYLKKIAGITGTKQIIFCTISFVVWVFSMGGPLKDVMIWGNTMQFLGAVFLPIYTLAIPLVYEK